MGLQFVVLGNGAIGTLSAIALKRKIPSANVILVGNALRANSASSAAGAMCNVFAEIEAPFSANHKELVDFSLWYGMKGREGWLDFIESDPYFEKIRTAKNTLVFLKKDASEFETNNYEAAKEAARDYGIARMLDQDFINRVFEFAQTTPVEAFQIEGEFSIDTRVLFQIFSKICVDLDVKFLDESVVEVDFVQRKVITANSKVKYDKLLVALGSNSSKYLPKGVIQDVVQGVGTAIEIQNKGIQGVLSEKNLVIRTVNRGGAQCGFHFVPRNNGYYLGAGNYIMLPGASHHRLETIRYLFSTFEREVCGSSISYQLEGNLVKGHRPRALDGFPLIGQLGDFPNVFIATGTNRAGLTWAPMISNQIATWAQDQRDDSKFSSLVSPDRSEINFGTEEEAITYYVESRIGAALEHGRIEASALAIEGERQRIKQYAQTLLAEVRKVKSNDNVVPHPDHWSVILEQIPRCVV